MYTCVYVYVCITYSLRKLHHFEGFGKLLVACNRMGTGALLQQGESCLTVLVA